MGIGPIENKLPEQQHIQCQMVQLIWYYGSLPVILKDFEHPSALLCLGQWKYIGKPKNWLSGNKNWENDQKLTRTRIGPLRRPRWGLSLSNFEASVYKNDGNSVARILIWELRALDIKTLNQIWNVQVKEREENTKDQRKTHFETSEGSEETRTVDHSIHVWPFGPCSWPNWVSDAWTVLSLGHRGEPFLWPYAYRWCVSWARSH